MIEMYLYGVLIGASLIGSSGMAINCYLRRQNPPVEVPVITPHEHHLEDVLGDIVEEQMTRRPESNHAQIKIKIKTNHSKDQEK
jgi:F0F1-type ATP synthase beta subunit